MTDLTGKKIAILLTDGYEDFELARPWEMLRAAGGSPQLIAPKHGPVHGKDGHSQTVDAQAKDVDASEYAALVLPGGVVSADHLRTDRHAVELVLGFVETDRPIAVIGHGAWILIEADGVDGRTMTSYPSLRTDLTNAGATWLDEEVVVDRGLISSRTPADLTAFTAALLREFAAVPQQA
ncbi:type 1 glutamine amidotransferase domain-containing protein [Granulicoccus phenolivorans]|uniref:type 1 glutamine amidotransferase domain-containing protein n=1 Tax=Granulicoccus phenolivorans TaxID=266854 RepID=UPI000410612F|nr:type 1 glutamine amidotransferase domain-containing protein [Granulicoccus phenolivorans]